MCGRTRFTVFADPTFASYCHCDDCRQSTGAAVSAFIGFDAADLVWQGEKLKGYKSSANVNRTFCPECGTSISYEDEKLPGKIYMYVGVMDHPFFAVTGMDGAFQIEGLPDGDYVIECWQQLLGTRSYPVSVSGGKGQLDVVYKHGR